MKFIESRFGRRFQTARQFVRKHSGRTALKRRQVWQRRRLEIVAITRRFAAQAVASSGAAVKTSNGSAAMNEYRPSLCFQSALRCALSKKTQCGKCASRANHRLG